MMVVTAASGRLGRSVARILAERGVVEAVTLTSRNPASLTDLAPLGFRLARADYGDPPSLRTAFAGAEAVLMISMSGPIEARIPRHRNAFDAVSAAGVSKLIYTSRVNPTYDSLYPFARIHAFSENYIRSLQIPAVIVRNNEYTENVVKLIDSCPDPDTILLPGAAGRVPYIPVAEIAEILAHLAAQDGHVGRTYEINGPEALNRDDIAAVVAEATARPVHAAPITGDAFATHMEMLGRPPFVVEMAKGLHAAIDAGEFATIHPDAERLLGRAPTGASVFLRQIYSSR